MSQSINKLTLLSALLLLACAPGVAQAQLAPAAKSYTDQNGLEFEVTPNGGGTASMFTLSPLGYFVINGATATNTTVNTANALSTAVAQCPHGNGTIQVVNGTLTCTANLADTLNFTTPFGNVTQCVNGNCTFQGGTAPAEIVGIGNGTITLEGSAAGAPTVINTYFDNGSNYCGHNVGSGANYYTYDGVLYGDGSTATYSMPGTANVTRAVAETTEQVINGAAAVGCVIVQ